MARTNVPINTLQGGATGVAPTNPVASDVANGNVINGASEHTWLEVTNTHATIAGTITFQTPGTVGGRAIADDVGTVPATQKRFFGPWDKDIFTENVAFDTSATTMQVVAYQTSLA